MVDIDLGSPQASPRRHRSSRAPLRAPLSLTKSRCVPPASENTAGAPRTHARESLLQGLQLTVFTPNAAAFGWPLPNHTRFHRVRTRHVPVTVVSCVNHAADAEFAARASGETARHRPADRRRCPAGVLEELGRSSNDSCIFKFASLSTTSVTALALSSARILAIPCLPVPSRDSTMPALQRLPGVV